MNNGRGHMRAMLGAVALATIAGSAPAGGPTLTRAEAAAALLDKGSGVDITPVAQVWSPYIDYGFGPGFEGLLPAGSTVEPARLNVEPWVSAPILLGVDQYFFWIDDLPKEDFVHGTRFVFVDPSVAAPTVGNGGISVFVEGWWPVINGVPFLELDIHRTTLAPAGPGNPDGLIAGFAFEPPPPPPAPPGGGSPANVADANACGIVVNGSNDTHHKNNATRMKNDLQNVDGVPAGRINTVAGGNAATEAQLCAAIDAIATMKPPCSKIYLRFTGHGGVGSLALAGTDELTEDELCDKLMTLGQAGVPVCVIINACHSGSMVEGAFSDWDLPAGSSVGTATTSDGVGYAGRHNDSDGNEFNESCYAYAFSQCKNSADADTDGVPGVSDREAHAWILATKPCYDFKGAGGNSYPGGGAPKGQPEGDVSTPTITVFDGPSCSRVIAKLERAIEKLERAIQKLQSIPPGAPPRKIIPILQAVIEQLDDTIAQLQAAIMQLEALQGPEGDCPPGANIPGAISEIGQAINATSIARQIVMELLQNPNLPPDVVQSMIGQAINQSSAAIGHAAAAINALFGGPPLCECPLGATDEGEPCGADTNGGCNSTPVTFGAIACSETICGTGWADGGTRDTDWYEVSLADCTVLTATLTSAFDGVVFIVDGIPNCAPVVVGQTGSSNQCTPIAPASAIVQPGTYVIFVAPATFEGVPCGSGANDYFVTLDCSPCPGGPPNDHCADRIVIEAGSIDYDTTGADTDGVAHAACQFDGQTYHDIWFNYVAAVDGTLLVTTCNTASYDTDLAVYLGCDPSTCPPGDSQLLACNDDAPGCAGFTSEVTIPVSCGQCYKIRVGGWNPGDAGAGTLTLVEAGTPCGGCPCQWDLDGDCHVGPADLAILLAAWNQPYGPPDLAALLAEWGCSDG